MRTRQLIIVEQDRLRQHEVRENVALFGPDGEPLLFNGSDDVDELKKQVKTLKGRLTKMDKRLKELEGE